MFYKNISKGVSYFERKEITAEDVTAQFVDIDARLKLRKPLKIGTSRIIKKKANKVTEMLKLKNNFQLLEKN
jgi:hypothetical protein